MTKVAIVILNWNGSDMLQMFLPSVIDSANPDVSIYVADNASQDDSVDVVKKNFPDVKLIILDKNYGYAEGYNRALSCVDAEYAVLLNSDVEVTKDWLAPLISFMDANSNVAACQPKILSWRDKSTFEYAGAAGGYIDCWGYPFCRGRLFGTVEKDSGQYDAVSKVFWATGAALFVRLTDFWDIGGLDSDFFAHMEEIDFAWRLHSRGKDVACVPTSVVYHVGAATLKESPRKTFLNFRNNLLMLYKNLPNQELSFIMAIRCVLDYVAAISFIIKGQFDNAKAVVKARLAYHSLKEDFEHKREENLAKSVSSTLTERTKFSLLVQYYLKRKRHFSDFQI